MTPELDTILYIDDEAENLRGFQFLFKRFYNILIATSADEGFELLKTNPVKLILADQRMPKMTGVEFFEIAAQQYPDIVRIVITGFSDIEAIINAINNGHIFKYVSKPWNKDELKHIIDNALWTYNISAENRKLVEDLKQTNAKLAEINQTLEQKVEQRTKQIQEQKTEIELQRDEARMLCEQIVQQNEEIENHRHKLEILVEERTADLLKAKEKAELSDKLKSAFLANFSHEIRTPMNAIMGFSQLLFYQSITEEEKKEFVELIYVNSQHLLNLINEIIDISRIEAGEMTIDPKPCNIYKIVNELVTQYEEQKHLIKKDAIKICIGPDVSENKSTIVTDESKLKQILINLIENALKFTEHGSIQLNFKLEVNYGTRELVLAVKDTGIGIDEISKAFIFDRFRKVENNNNEKLYRGAGLGLAISKRLSEILGGRIWLESMPNEGSTFYVALPYRPAVPEISSANQSINSTSKKDWQGKVILVAEDEATNFKYIEKALARTKINLKWAKNGLESFEMVKSDKSIELILMDIRMPIMNGFEATKLIKEFRSELPIIAQTAYAMENEKDEILKAGCDDYIAKPYTDTDLIELINRHLPA